MARPGIGYDQVAQVADALTAAGESPTIALVRQRLGSGSPNTIHRHLTAWQKVQPAGRRTPTLPDGLQAAILRELEHQATQARAEAEARMKQVEAEATELARAGEAMEAELLELNEALAGMRAERDSAVLNAQGRAGEIDRLRAEVAEERAAAEAARIEAAQTRLRAEGSMEALQNARGEIAKLHEAIESERSARALAAQEAAELRGEIKTLRELRFPPTNDGSVETR